MDFSFLFVSIFLVMVPIVGFIIYRFRLASKCRTRHLSSTSRIKSWADIVRGAHGAVSIVQIDFGFGNELWILDQPGNTEKDLRFKIFCYGTLISPPPRKSELNSFCSERGIEPIMMQVKL